MRYVALFVAIQIVAFVLALVGAPICGILALGKFATLGPLLPSGVQLWHWPKWAWLWDNDEDGVEPSWFKDTHPKWPVALREFVWTAFRNPVNNLRYVKRFLWLPISVSLKGRALWRKTWGDRPGGWYAQAGWNSSGFPVLSAGRNVNPY